jgi:chromosome segregation ATPase
MEIKYKFSFKAEQLQSSISQTEYDLECLEEAMKEPYYQTEECERQRRNLKSSIARYKRQLADLEEAN